MKYSHMVLLVSLFMSIQSQAFAARTAEACAFGEQTWELTESFDASNGRFQKLRTKNPKDAPLTNLEMSIVSEAVASSYGKDTEELDGLTELERLDIFMDVPYGSNAGNLVYFRDRTTGIIYVLATYYPGDNEYGIIAQVTHLTRSNTFKTVAVVGDGFMDKCKVTR